MQKSTEQTINLHPTTARQIQERGGSWALYQNQALDSSNAGHVQGLRYGEDCTYSEPPPCMPDTSHGAGWKYRLVCTIEATDMPTHGRLVVREGKASAGPAPMLLPSGWSERMSEMVRRHDQDFGGKKFKYLTNCVLSTAEKIDAMTVQAKEITYGTFAHRCETYPFTEVFGYTDETGLHLCNDAHVAYYKSKYEGKPCYYLVHSAIEWVFVQDECAFTPDVDDPEYCSACKHSRDAHWGPRGTP